MDWTVAQAPDKTETNTWPTNEDQFFGESINPCMRELEQVIAHVAPTDFPILIMGESGVGKEAVAAHIHQRSRHHEKQFKKIVCGALTPDLFDVLQNECGGANGGGEICRVGTLFLDEITDLAASFQASLLHAIPDGEGASIGPFLRARIISTSSKTSNELDQVLDQGILRRDLFYRLNGVCLRLPPLRERREDIPRLVEFLLRKYSMRLGLPQPVLNARTLQILQEFTWPGNIRELENTAKRIVALGVETAVSDLGWSSPGTKNAHENHESLSLKEAARAASRQVEKEMILKVLARTHWNRKRAAQHLQISYKALLNKLRQMGLDESGSL